MFSSRLLHWLTTFPAIIYISTALAVRRADDLYLYVFLYQVFYFVLEILSFGFCLVNYESDAYLPDNYSLVYGNPKMFLILSVESNLELCLKPYCWIHISISF